MGQSTPLFRAMLSPFETLHSGKAYLIRSSYDAAITAQCREDLPPRAREEGMPGVPMPPTKARAAEATSAYAHMDPALGASGASTALSRPIA